MRIKYEIVNPVSEQYLLEYKLERTLISVINNYRSLKSIKKLRLPLQGYFPELEESKKFNEYHFYQYVINDNNEVYCYETDLTIYDKGEYEHSPLSKAVLVHKFNIARK